MITVGRVRAWFILTGLFSMLTYGAGVVGMLAGGPRGGAMLVAALFYAMGFLWNLVFVGLGLRLRGLLVANPALVDKLVKANLGLSVLSFNPLAIGLNYVLYKSLARLAAQETEAQSRVRPRGFEAFDR